MNIALIVHFTPQNPEGGQGRGHVVSSSEMAGGKKKSQEGRTPHNRYGGGGGGGGKVEGVCRHSEKTGSSFQTPVQAIE